MNVIIEEEKHKTTTLFYFDAGNFLPQRVTMIVWPSLFLFCFNDWAIYSRWKKKKKKASIYNL
jgi:hypothetical protein